MKIRVLGIPSPITLALRRGAPDANGQPALAAQAEGQANPCRHCLGLIKEGDEMLVFSHRPFNTVQPYAETGPVFLHATDCVHYDADTLPGWFQYLEPALIRGYDDRDWIRYETGKVVSGPALDAECRAILARPEVAYVHIRSRFNCFQCRVERG